MKETRFGKEELRDTLEALDGRGYKAYKEIKGLYEFETFQLSIDHVQGDPFAAASKLRIFIDYQVTGHGKDSFAGASRQTAFEDYLIRRFYTAANTFSRSRGTGKSGLITIDRPGQQIIKRTACLIHSDHIEIRFIVGLPANGRKILGQQAAAMLGDDIPKIVERSLLFTPDQKNAIITHITTHEDADYIRGQLTERSIVAFIANGSILPRRTGIDDRPLENDALPFESPKALQISFDCPNQGRVTGMGIPEGITLIVGGGYHGKSTLLQAIEKGVYNHIPGDGREGVITHPAAVKIKSEEGRSISRVGISPFINNLPFGRSTTQFSTDNASGSTSQAANIIESIEAGCEVLLLDEDTSATNFMIRDRRMQALINKEREPITPFTDKIQSLYSDYGISTILVMGGSGDYFDCADQVLAMDQYIPQVVTERAKEVAKAFVTGRVNEGGEHFGVVKERTLSTKGFNPASRNKESYLKTRSTDEITFGNSTIDLSSVDQLVHESQLRAMALAMKYARNHLIDEDRSLKEICATLQQLIRDEGFSAIHNLPDGDLAFFRVFELAAAINRLRGLTITNITDR